MGNPIANTFIIEKSDSPIPAPGHRADPVPFRGILVEAARSPGASIVSARPARFARTPDRRRRRSAGPGRAEIRAGRTVFLSADVSTQ